MTLDSALQQNNGELPLALLRPMTDAVTTLQSALTAAGLLDPPSDGVLGPVTHWALGAYAARARLPYAGALTTAIWERLRADPQQPLFALSPGGDLAGRVVSTALSKRWFVNGHPECRNIFYVEGCNVDGTPNANTPNAFNDLRLVIGADDQGRPTLLGAWEGTTEPGRYWTIHPMNAKGAARIAFGQYKAWSRGTHHVGLPTAHEALVQTAPITVFRDLNEDFSRKGDTPETGIFAVNQHWGYDNPQGDLGSSSAGCLVGRTKAGHIQFMALCKSDARYLANSSYRFMSGVLPVADLP